MSRSPKSPYENEQLLEEENSPEKQGNKYLLTENEDICIESESPANIDFYKKVFNHAKKKSFKEFYTEMMDLMSKQSLENFEKLNRKFLFEDIKTYLNNDDKNLYKNIVKNYFSTENSFPILKPTTIICQKGYPQSITALILSADSKNLIVGNDASIQIWEIDDQNETYHFKGTLLGHEYKITVLTINRTTTKIYSGSQDHTIRIWDFTSRESIVILRGHTSEISAIRLTESGDLISACMDKLIIVWNLERNEQKRIFEGIFNDYVFSIETANNLIFLVCVGESFIRVWAEKSFARRPSLVEHEKEITHMSIDSNKKILVSRSNDNKIVLWDVNKLILIKVFQDDSSPNKILIIPNSNAILCVNEQFIRKWDITLLDPKKIDLDFPGSVTGNMAEITADSERMFTYVFDENNEGSFCCVNLNPLKIKIFNHLSNISQKMVDKIFLNFTEDSKYLIWAEKAKIKIWNLEENKMENDLEDQKLTQDIDYLRCSKNCDILVSGCKNGLIFVWDFIKRNIMMFFPCNYKPPIVISNDSKTIAFNTQQNEILFFDANSLQSIQDSFFLPPQLKINSFVLSSDFKTIWLGCADGLYIADYYAQDIKKIDERCITNLSIIEEVCIIAISPKSVVTWDVITKEKLKVIELKAEKNTNQITVASKNLIVYGQFCNYNLKIIDFDEKCLGFLNQNLRACDLKELTINRDGHLVAASTPNGGPVYVWLINKNEKMCLGNAHSSSIQKIAILNKSNTKQIISIDSKMILKKWDLKKNSLLLCIDLKKYGFNEVSEIKIADDLTKIISAIDNFIIIFDLVKNQQFINVIPEISSIHSFTLFPDEFKIIVTEKNNVFILNVNTYTKQSSICLECSEIRTCSLAPNAEDLVVVDITNKMIIMNLKTKNQVEVQNIYCSRVTFVEFVPDSTKFITLIEKKCIAVWDTKTGSFLESNEFFEKSILAFQVLPDKRIFFSCSDRTLNEMNPTDFQEIDKTLLADLDYPISSMAIDSESNSIVLGDENGGLIIKDLKSFDKQMEMIDYSEKNCSKKTVKSIYLSPDEKKIIADCGTEIILWDAKTKKQIIKLKNYKTPIFISSDQLLTKMVIIKPQNELIIWDLITMKKIGEFEIFEKLHGETCIEKVEIHENKTIIAGCSDGTIHILDLETKKPITILKPISKKAVKKIVIIPESNSILVGHSIGYTQFVSKNGSSYKSEEYDSFDVCDLRNLKIIDPTLKHHEKGKSFTQILYLKTKEQIIIGTSDSKLYIYETNDQFKLKNLLSNPANAAIISINEMPNDKIITMDSEANVFVWNIMLQLLCCRFQYQNDPLDKFLFKQNMGNFVLNGFNALDLKNDLILFERKLPEQIKDFLVDSNSEMIFLTNDDEIQFSPIRRFQNTYEDLSLLKYSIVGNKEFNMADLLSKNLTMLPFKFNMLHVLAIIESFEKLELEELNKENWITFSKIKIPIIGFLQLDFRDKTCLDILLDHNNKTVFPYFMKKIFEEIKNEDSRATFYQKLKFFSYDFNYNQKNFVQIILDKILDLFGEDTDILNEIFNSSFVTLDSEIFCPNLMKSELNEPIYLTTSNFGWLKDENAVKKAIDEKLQIIPLIHSDEGKKLVKCSVLLLKGITNISPENCKIWDKILKLESSNSFYANKILEILINYKWNSYGYSFFFNESLVFLFFFLLFLINFIYIFPNRLSNDPDNNINYIIVSIVFDSLDLLYFLFYVYRELSQIMLLKKSYFNDFWNFIDILVLLGAFASLILDLIYIGETNDVFALKIITAITFLFLWMRILSYSRGFKGTGFLVRLVKQTIVDMRYFLLVIFLLLLAFGSAAFMLQNEFSHSPFYVFNLVYRLILGDYTNYDSFDDEMEKPVILWIGMIIFSVLLSIIMLNLLISIIGATFGKVVETAKSMRNIELLSVINEIEKNKVYDRKKHELQKNNVIGDYLICFHNENHFKEEESIQEDIKRNVEDLNNQIKENKLEMMQYIDENQIEMKKVIEETRSEMKKAIENTRNEINETVGGSHREIVYLLEKIFITMKDMNNHNNHDKIV